MDISKLDILLEIRNCNLEILILFYIFSSLLHVPCPVLGNFHENLKRRFNNEIQNKDKNIYLGKFLRKPLAGGDNRGIKKINQESKNIFFLFHHDKLPDSPPDADAEKAY